MDRKLINILKVSVAATALLSLDTFAAIKALSRANCLGFVNESITYERPQFRYFVGTVASTHTPLGNTTAKHVIGAPNNGYSSWRFRAGDQTDPERMSVSGWHVWILGGLSEVGPAVVWTQRTVAVDCNLSEW